MSWRCSFSDNDSAFSVRSDMNTDAPNCKSSFSDNDSTFHVGCNTSPDSEVETSFGQITPLNGAPGLSAYEIALKHGFDGTEEEWLESLGGVNFKTDDTLVLEDGVLRVNTTDVVEDNTLPITAAAVNATVGNIEALLGTI